MPSEISIPIPDNDAERLKILQSYLVLDSPPEIAFDRITSFAKRLFGVEIALLSLVDQDRQWFKSKQGLEAQQTERSVAFCAYAIMDTAPDVFLVLEPQKDPRFCNNPLVTGPPHIRFYAGAPLIVEQSFKIGTLCIISSRSRKSFSIREKMDLTTLAAIVVDELRLRRHKMRASLKYISSLSAELKRPLTSFAVSLGLLGCTELTEEQHSLLLHAKGNLELMEWTMENALAASRFQGTTSNYRPCLRMIAVEDIFKKLRHISNYFPKMVPVSFEIGKLVPQVFYSDAACILHAMLNLITNSCKNTTEGEIVVAVSTYSSSHERNSQDSQEEGYSEWLRFTVEDSGPGVKDPNLLFKPLGYRLQSGTENQGMTQSGSGLGLYSVYLQMESLGGHCGYHPRTDGNQGSLFWIEIPNIQPSLETERHREDFFGAYGSLTQTDAQAVSSNSFVGLRTMDSTLQDFHMKEDSPFTINQPARSQRPGQLSSHLLRLPGVTRLQTYTETSEGSREKSKSLQETISPINDPENLKALTIDDNLTIRKTLKVLLEKQGFIVDTACNGAEGLHLLKTNEYTLIYCDFLMPILSGPECITLYMQWRNGADCSQLPPFIVGISANADQTDINNGFKAGMDAFQQKPIKPKVMKEMCSLAKTAREYNMKKARLAKSGTVFASLGRWWAQKASTDSSPNSLNNTATHSPTDEAGQIFVYDESNICDGCHPINGYGRGSSGTSRRTSSGATVDVHPFSDQGMCFRKRRSPKTSDINQSAKKSEVQRSVEQENDREGKPEVNPPQLQSPSSTSKQEQNKPEAQINIQQENGLRRETAANLPQLQSPSKHKQLAKKLESPSKHKQSEKKSGFQDSQAIELVQKSSLTSLLHRSRTDTELDGDEAPGEQMLRSKSADALEERPLILNKTGSHQESNPDEGALTSESGLASLNELRLLKLRRASSRSRLSIAKELTGKSNTGALQDNKPPSLSAPACLFPRL